MNVSNTRGSGSRSGGMVSSGGWSGRQYDVMSYQEAARSGQIQVRHGMSDDSDVSIEMTLVIRTRPSTRSSTSSG